MQKFLPRWSHRPDFTEFMCVIALRHEVSKISQDIFLNPDFGQYATSFLFSLLALTHIRSFNKLYIVIL